MSDQEMTVSGEIVHIGQVEHVGAKETPKQIIAVRTGDKYPQDIGVEFFSEGKVGLLNGYALGDTVEVAFNLRGREYQGRYYVNLGGWRICRLDGAGLEQGQPEPVEAEQVNETGSMPF